MHANVLSKLKNNVLYSNELYQEIFLLGPQKLSGFWSSVGFKIGAVTRFICFAIREIRDTRIRWDQIAHTQSRHTVAKRGRTN